MPWKWRFALFRGFKTFPVEEIFLLIGFQMYISGSGEGGQVYLEWRQGLSRHDRASHGTRMQVSSPRPLIQSLCCLSQLFYPSTSRVVSWIKWKLLDWVMSSTHPHLCSHGCIFAIVCGFNTQISEGGAEQWVAIPPAVVAEILLWVWPAVWPWITYLSVFDHTVSFICIRLSSQL